MSATRGCASSSKVRDRHHLAQVIKTIRRMPDGHRVFRTLGVTIHAEFQPITEDQLTTLEP